MEAVLACPFDPWIEDYSRDDALKRSFDPSWVNLAEAADVFRDASRMVERLNGEALLIHDDAKPVKLGNIMRFGPHSRREFFTIGETAHYRMTMGEGERECDGRRC